MTIYRRGSTHLDLALMIGRQGSLSREVVQLNCDALSTCDQSVNSRPLYRPASRPWAKATYSGLVDFSPTNQPLNLAQNTKPLYTGAYQV